MIIVLGATGHTGRVVAEQLLNSGSAVKVVGRSADKLKPLTDRGAASAIGDVEDASFLTSALTGSSAAYVLMPPDYSVPDYLGRYQRIGAAIHHALVNARVPRVAFLSSLGGELGSGTGLIVGLHRMEELLKTIPNLDLLILRPASFFVNQLAQLGLIKHNGITGGVEPADVKSAHIDPTDVGIAAASALRTKDFSGVSVRELLGPRDLSPREIAGIIGASIGKPDLPYVTFSHGDYVDGLVKQAGFPRPVAELFLEMAVATGSGVVRAHAPRTPATTGTHTFESFASTVIAPAYQRM